MPNPGVFQGPRKDWLLAQLKGYGQSLDQNLGAEYIRSTQRRFLARWPITLPLDQEQSEEFLANVDDDAPLEEPDLSNLSQEEKDSLANNLRLRKAVSSTCCFLFGN